MAALGLTWVRIGEFAWSRMEPEPGRYDLRLARPRDRYSGAAGLKVVLGTPTATPPRWMLTATPTCSRWTRTASPAASARAGTTASPTRATARSARRSSPRWPSATGKNPHVAAWQTDNEYACHATTLSYSDAARRAFRDWLAQRYQSPDALNRAWGNVFWSMEYRDFDEIGLPNLTVTEPNPGPCHGLPPLSPATRSSASTACRPRSSASTPPPPSPTTTWAR